MPAAVTAAVRMVYGIHHDTADSRSYSFTAFAAGRTDLYILVLFITDGADARRAFKPEFADFAARHPDKRIIAFFSHKLGFRSGRTDSLAAFAGLKFNIVYHSSGRYFGKLQTVSNFDRSTIAA
jgi:hypothetical protein